MKSTSFQTRAVLSVLGAVLVVAAACAPAAAPPAPTTTNSVTVTQVLSGDDSPCVPTSSAIPSGTMTRTYASSPIEFVLTVDVANPLCSPINAAAVIYSMPGNGVAWPQSLAAFSPFTVQDAGTTEIRFAKGCSPAQFDVITGNPTQTVSSPLGAPSLLFPFDIATAEQFWGNGTNCGTTTTSTIPCPEPTTTTEVTTTVPETTTTVETTTTTVPETTTTTEVTTTVPETTTTVETTTTTVPETTTTTGPEATTTTLDPRSSTTTVPTTTTTDPNPTLPLKNVTAPVETDCPGEPGPYWHFVFAPNNGSAVFTSITLNLKGTLVTFTGADIIKNGSQADNVFVKVPAGYLTTDLQLAGSQAGYTGSAPKQFVLSHICPTI